MNESVSRLITDIRCVTFLTCFILISTFASSQSLSMGLGVNYSNSFTSLLVSDDGREIGWRTDLSIPGIGYQIDANLYIPITKRFGISVIPSYSMRQETKSIFYDFYDQESLSYKYRIRDQYVDIPILLTVGNHSTEKGSLYVLFGPNISYWISSRVEDYLWNIEPFYSNGNLICGSCSIENSGWRKLDLENSEGYNRLIYGANLGFSYTVNRFNYLVMLGYLMPGSADYSERISQVYFKFSFSYVLFQ